MPSYQQQEIYLKKLRNVSNIDPSIHPKWSRYNWLYYIVWFPFEYTLIILFVIPSCLLSFIVGIIDFIKQIFVKSSKIDENKLKDNLKQNKNNKNNKNNDMVSIIIPCYNESSTIKQTLLYLDMNCFDHKNIEIILVDGNSPDIDNFKKAIKEIEIHLNIKSSQIKIICDKDVKGRGICQNIGALQSNGKYLLFIHADTVLPNNYDLIIRNTLKNKNILLGSFQFAIDRSLMIRPIPGIGWVEFFARFRNKLLKLPWGDQTFWITNDNFTQIGGFKWFCILEDIEFIFRCRKIATTSKKIIYIDSNFAYCSPRRWEKNGVAYNTVWNQWVLFLFKTVGLSPEKIYQIYYGRKL